CSGQNTIYRQVPTNPRQSVVTPPTTPITTSTGQIDHTATAIVGGIGVVLHGLGQEASQHGANNNLARLTQALNGFDLRSDLAEAARVEFAKVTTMKVDVRPAVTNCWQAMTTAFNDRSKSSAVLLLDVSYFLSSDARSVGLATNARIFPRTSTTNIPVDPVDVIYNHVFEYDFLYSSRQDVRVAFDRAARALFSRVAAALK
ncbi:MAG TPA: hypothetical protein VD858_05345, partial [Reyranella sp.]|nr:hypothetical protein [Reyranella sp.]